MAKCEVCGNDYDKSFTVTTKGKAHTFDSFECAIHALAPKCSHCGCKIIGHGVENNGLSIVARAAPRCRASRDSKTASSCRSEGKQREVEE